MRDDFKPVLEKVANSEAQDWEGLTQVFRKEVRQWEDSKNTLGTLLKRIEKEVLELNGLNPGLYDPSIEVCLQREHEAYMFMQEFY